MYVLTLVELKETCHLWARLMRSKPVLTRRCLYTPTFGVVMLKVQLKVMLVLLVNMESYSYSLIKTNNNNESLRRTMQIDLRMNDCRNYRLSDAWYAPDEKIAKTRSMNSLLSIPSPNAYQVQWTHKWKNDSIEESKLNDDNKHEASCGYIATKSL